MVTDKKPRNIPERNDPRLVDEEYRRYLEANLIEEAEETED